MDEKLVKEIFFLISNGSANEALRILNNELFKLPNDYYIYYLLGLSYRTANDFDNAIVNYKKSIKYDESHYFIYEALGIAYQLKENYEKAIESFKKSITLNEYAISSYNSLGLTYKKANNIKYALNAYEVGIYKLIESIINEVGNNKNNERAPQINFTENNYWSEIAFKVFTDKAVKDNKKNVYFPTSESALDYYSKNEDGGLLWREIEEGRYMLPNYIDTIYKGLKTNQIFCIMMNNIGIVKSLEKKTSEAIKLFNESIEFIPYGFSYPPPFLALKSMTD